MEGNIIDAAKNLLGGDFTTELRFRYITTNNAMTEIELDGGAYMIIANYGEIGTSGMLRLSSDYTDYKVVYISWDSNGPKLNLINSLPVTTYITDERFNVFFAARCL